MEEIKKAIEWIDYDLRETMRDYLRNMASYDDIHTSVDRLEAILISALDTQKQKIVSNKIKE